MNKSIMELVKLLSDIITPVANDISSIEVKYVKDKGFRAVLIAGSEKSRTHFGKIAKSDSCERLSISYGDNDE